MASEIAIASELEPIPVPSGTSSSAQAPDSTDTTTKVAVAIFLLCLAGAGITFFILAGSIGGDDDDAAPDVGEGRSGGGGGGGGSPPPLPLPIQVAGSATTSSPKRRPQPRHPPSTTPTTTTTTTVPPRRELICTVGGIATEYRQYPEDGLCHYIYYTHVLTRRSNVTAIQSTRFITSFKVFQERIPKYKKTQGGLSFDVRKTNRDIGNHAVASLKELQAKNIVHYGSLNVIDRIATLGDLVARALALVKELKRLQEGDASKRTVIAIGGIGYSDPPAWRKYTDLIKEAANAGTGIDTVIAISSVSDWLEEMSKCKTVPPAFITASNKDYPSLDRHMELVNEASESIYGNKDVYVGLSLEMGAWMYSFDADQPSALTRNPLYQHCKAASLVPLDMGCDSGSKVHVKDTYIAYGTDTKKVVMVFDNDVTVAEKVEYVLEKKPRKRFAWLYFNVHMADLLGKCKMPKPFTPILVLRKDFNIGDKP